MAVVGPTPLGSAVRALMHVLIVSFGWALFAYGWVRVAARPWDAQELWVLIVASAVVLPSLTVLWIAHNVVWYRGRQRRREAARVDCRYEVDWAGQSVEADWPTLTRADRVRVDIESGAKRFHAIVPVPVPFTPGSAGAPDETVAVPASGAVSSIAKSATSSRDAEPAA